MAAIRIEGLQKTYGKVRALDGLDLTVEPGTVFGFLGANGAGKTTTIRILTGLAHATAGRVWVHDQEIGGVHRTAGAHHIGHVPEEPAFYPWMTPREFLDYVGQVFGLATAERAARVKELLALLGLTEVRRRRIGGFSRGMRQRLGLAQALMNRPTVLCLDEPVSALDPAGRKEVLEIIEGLRGQCTVFMSSHILADVERVCDTLGIIAHGKLLTQTPRATLLAQYATPIFELEIEPGFEAPLATWAEMTRRAAWVQALTCTGLITRVVVSDVAEAKRGLLPTAVQAGLVLTRFEMLKPSLEEVFLRLVGESEQPA